ncbi:MAG: ATPase, T2SS/T4P/T4SS family [Albidovulum sp.]|nr:Flp pilus assembly complex ATPase component TadA [Zoogloea sp.]
MLNGQSSATTPCRIIEQPSGLFLVTGPTGSGKTTTLYTALSHLNTKARKIVTVEDPVEYSLPGIQQVQVHEAIGLTFARVLRGVLRHDPNVILVGEIRDEETAEIAARAAQVGRMVLSTLHTNSAEAAVTRLVDLGVPDFVVSEVLRGVLAQDLVGVWCRACQDEGCAACAGRSRDGAPVGRRLRVELRVGG